jgi:hypothetical protein
MTKNRRRYAPVIFLAGIFAFSATTTAVDLNTEIPATTTVTIRSEMERGMKAMPNPLDFEIAYYSDAVSAVENRNRQQNTLSEPFEFGFHYAMWHEFWNLLSMGFYKAESSRRLAVATMHIDFVLTMAIQKRLGLSDEDIASIASVIYVENENALFFQSC